MISKGQTYLLGSKWTHEKVDKGSDETINKTYAEYKQKELNEKSEKTGKALGKNFINLYSAGVSRWLKIKAVKKLRQDIGNNLIIKDQMANLGYLLVCTFGNFLTPVLVAVHTANNLDLDDELDRPAAVKQKVEMTLPSASQPSQHEQNEDYKKGLKRTIFRHPSGWWDWCFPEDEKRDTEALWA